VSVIDDPQRCVALNENSVTDLAAERYPNVQLHFEHKLSSYDLDKRQLVFERSALDYSRSLVYSHFVVLTF